MNRTSLRLRIILQLFLAANASLLFAQTSFTADGVTCVTNRSLFRQGAELTLVTKEMAMPGGIQVLTNGTFCVNGGKPRLLKPGQLLRPDGFLLNPDGSTRPVWDHIEMRGSTVRVFRDAEGANLTDAFTLPDGSVINPNGSYERPNPVRRSRLVDGQLLTLTGDSLAGLDTISFSQGKVVVYKAGALIPITSPDVIIGMNDATRVRGDGFITFHDGTTTQMADGQIIMVPGVRASW